MKKCFLCVADSAYLKRYAVMLTSFIENCQTFDLDVKILSVASTSEQEDLLLFYFRSNFPKISFDVIHLTDAQLEKIKSFPEYDRVDKNTYISETTLYKIFGVEIVKSLGYDRCLYMDPDIFVNGDVSFMTTRLESVNKICAAETNYITKRTTKIDNSFNAGVMLFNLTEFEQKDFDDFTDRVVKYGNIFGDQYIFNKLYHSVYEPLSIEYNSCERGNVDNPVMHFTGANKPWNSRNYEYDKRLRLYTEFVVKNYSRFSDAYLDITP